MDQQMKIVISKGKERLEPMPSWYEGVMAASRAVDAEDAHWRRVDGVRTSFPRFDAGVRP